MGLSQLEASPGLNRKRLIEGCSRRALTEIANRRRDGFSRRAGWRLLRALFFVGSNVRDRLGRALRLILILLALSIAKEGLTYLGDRAFFDKKLGDDHPSGRADDHARFICDYLDDRIVFFERCAALDKPSRELSLRDALAEIGEDEVAIVFFHAHRSTSALLLSAFSSLD